MLAHNGNRCQEKKTRTKPPGNRSHWKRVKVRVQGGEFPRTIGTKLNGNQAMTTCNIKTHIRSAVSVITQLIKHSFYAAHDWFLKYV